VRYIRHDKCTTDLELTPRITLYGILRVSANDRHRERLPRNHEKRIVKIRLTMAIPQYLLLVGKRVKQAGGDSSIFLSGWLGEQFRPPSGNRPYVSLKEHYFYQDLPSEVNLRTGEWHSPKFWELLSNVVDRPVMIRRPPLVRSRLIE